MITAPGAYPEDCCRGPQYPLAPLITLTVQERADGTHLATAWAVGTDCRRCTREWVADKWIATGYPEVWERGLRLLIDGVKLEMEQAGIWEPKPETFMNPPQDEHRENAVHEPRRATPEHPPAP